MLVWATRTYFHGIVARLEFVRISVDCLECPLKRSSLERSIIQVEDTLGFENFLGEVMSIISTYYGSGTQGAPFMSHCMIWTFGPFVFGMNFCALVLNDA